MPDRDGRTEYTEDDAPPDFDWMSTFQQDWEMSNRIHEDSGVRCVCVRSGEWCIFM